MILFLLNTMFLTLGTTVLWRGRIKEFGSWSADFGIEFIVWQPKVPL
jgi:hypothetical protein